MSENEELRPGAFIIPPYQPYQVAKIDISSTNNGSYTWIMLANSVMFLVSSLL